MRDASDRSYRPTMKGVVLAAFALLMAFSPISGTPATAASTPPAGSTRSGPRVGQSVLLASPFEDRRIQVTIIEFTDPLDVPQASRRGFRSVAVHLAVTNRGSKTFRQGDSQFLLVDDAGLYAFDMSWQYSAAALKDHKPLQADRIDGGETASGWLIFEISVEARPAAMIYLGYDLPPYFGLLAWLDPVPPDGAGAVPILDASGNALGAISIDHIITNFERTDDGIDPVRGSSTLGLAVTVTNTSDEKWSLRSRDGTFWLADQHGLLYPRVGYERSMSSYQIFPELGFSAGPAEVARGVLTFEIPDDSDFAQLLYIPNDEQIHIVGGPNPTITVTGDIALKTIDIVSRTSLDPACAGVEAWAEGSWVSMAAAAELVDGLLTGEEPITPAALREGAAALRSVAQDQRQLTVPDEAQQAQSDVLSVLDVSAQALETGADHLEAGESADSVADSLEAPQSPISVAVKTAVTSLMALSQECPIGAM